MKKTLWVLLYSAACGLLLMIYSQFQDILKYLFSLGAVILGIRFFRRFETRGMRISFILLGVFFYFLFAVIYTFVAYIKGWPIQGAPGAS